MSEKNAFPKGTIFLFLSLLVLLAVIYLVPSANKKTIPPELIAVLRPHAVPLLPFTLTDQKEQSFTEKQFKGKWSFVFFGYTYCPDVCPTTLSTLKLVNSAVQEQPTDAAAMQVVFVSVDPKRDKPEILEKYTTFFNPEFIAVTGYPESLQAFSRQFGAAYIHEPSDASGNYLVSHTSSIFLVDSNARIVATFSPPHNPETITSQYLQIRELFR